MISISSAIKDYNHQVWNVAGITLFSIRACKFKIPRLFPTKNKVVKEEKVESNVFEDLKLRAKLRFLRNSTCEITGEYIGGKDDFYIHWIIPKEHGSTDDINNLIILHSSFKAILNDKNKADYYKDNKNYQNLLKAFSKYK